MKMVKGLYEGEEFIYEGDIQSLGEYPSRKVKGVKVWMGKTDHGFIYACHGGGIEPLVLGTTHADDILRFIAPFDSFKEIEKYFNKTVPMPESCLGAIALRALKLKKAGERPSYISEELKKIVNSL